MKKTKLYEVLQWASSHLEEYKRDPSVAQMIIEHHLSVTRSQFFLHMRSAVPAQKVERIKEDIKKHALSGVPVQHLLGYTYFYGRKFTVNENVLIPRFETEELVHHIIQRVSEDSLANNPVVDIGTGSGVIATTLALEISDMRMYATDISPEALQVAKRNAEKHHANITFLQGNYVKPIIEANINPQIIVSNPPYIQNKIKHTLSDTVKQYDPHIALFGGNDGLDAYRTIVNQTKRLPKREDRLLCFEIGYDQAEDVTTIIRNAYAHSKVVCKQDINGHDRIIIAKI